MAGTFAHQAISLSPITPFKAMTKNIQEANRPVYIVGSGEEYTVAAMAMELAKMTANEVQLLTTEDAERKMGEVAMSKPFVITPQWIEPPYMPTVRKTKHHNSKHRGKRKKPGKKTHRR